MTTRARSRSSPSACVRLRGRGDDRWTRCSELLVSIRERSTRQPELPQAGPSDSQRGGRARAHLNTPNCRAAARAPSVQTMLFECRPCYFPLTLGRASCDRCWDRHPCRRPPPCLLPPWPSTRHGTGCKPSRRCTEQANALPSVVPRLMTLSPFETMTSCMVP